MKKLKQHTVFEVRARRTNAARYWVRRYDASGGFRVCLLEFLPASCNPIHRIDCIFARAAAVLGRPCAAEAGDEKLTGSHYENVSPVLGLIVGVVYGALSAASMLPLQFPYARILVLGAVGGALIGWLVGRFGH